MNMLCSRCKKRVAVVFMTRMEGDSTVNEGLCLKCARELGIKPVNDLMEKMGITDDEIDHMSDQFDQIVDKGELEDSFEMGGAQPFPFLQGLFGGPPVAENKGEEKKTGGELAERRASGEGGQPRSRRPAKRKFLDGYCENLTAKAREGRLDKIIGRDKEIERLVQILNRRTKNNPCLIGEPGVGKTAIAEGIAQRIANENVPARIADKEIYLLDLAALVAGTQFRGQFESRVKGLVEEIRQAGNVILFIDEVHNLVGAGDSEGSMNAANILKPALSRGEIQVIGATTFTEYRKYIEKDAALERRFQPVKVEEPSIGDTVEMLMGVRQYYEKYHRVTVAPPVVSMAVTLSERYITDRFLPDKAIDLLDEACSCSVLANTALSEYDSVQRKIRELTEREEELEAKDDRDYEALAQLKAELLRMHSQARALEPEALGKDVTLEDLARVVELWTGIPASRIRESELKKVAGLGAVLKSHIIGQDEAVELVEAAVRRSRVQISPRRRPASFIFVGPTGVGKTELAKVLSKELFDSADPLIRLDMSEFMEKHAVSRIIGSPPGYVGYDEAGQLTEKTRRKPYSVVLFDEIEKAHPDVMNILLQILDEGRITDAHGRVVSFENTILIMTSNSGSSQRRAALGFDKSTEQLEKERVQKALAQFLRPEFLGRVDEVVTFRALELPDFEKIAGLMLTELQGPMSEKGITFSWDESALAYIAQKAYGEEHKSGARDLRRVIRKEVEDKISLLLVERAENPPAALRLIVEKGEDKAETLVLRSE